MKRTPAAQHRGAFYGVAIGTAAALMLLAGCGQKGPLFMPAPLAAAPAASVKPLPAGTAAGNTGAPGAATASPAASPGSTAAGTSAIPAAGNVVPVTPAPVTPDSPAMTAPPGAVVPTNK